MDDCVFCRILTGELPGSMVYRDEQCAAFMDIQPINPGHVLVIPTRHAADLADLGAATTADLMTVAHRLAAALRASGLRCEGVNLFLADGAAAGQEVFHVHLHVFPRYIGEGFGFATVGTTRTCHRAKTLNQSLCKFARPWRDLMQLPSDFSWSGRESA
jgi:histidine triad (HIT) family protein